MQLPCDRWDCVVVDQQYDVVRYEVGEVTEQNSVGERDHFDGWCGIKPCSEPLPPPRTATIIQKTEEEVCWMVGGSATADAKTGLATRLIAALDVQLNINGSYSDCELTSEEKGFEIPVPNCEDLDWWEEWTTEHVYGTAEEIDEVWTWECSCNGGTPVETTCGKRSASGPATEVQSWDFKTEEPPCCEPPPGEICWGRIC